MSCWTGQELDYLKLDYGIRSNGELVKVLSHSGGAIRTKASRLKVKKDYDWRTNQVDLKPSSSLAYIIGVVFGDGSVNYQRKGYRRNYNIDLFVTDRDFAETFQAALHDVIGKQYAIVLYGNRFQIRGQSKQLYLFLKDKNLIALDPFIRGFPASFIRGFADSEGSASPCKNNGYNGLKLGFACTNRQVIEYIACLLKSIGIATSQTHRQPKPSIKSDGSLIQGKKTLFTLSIHKKSSIKRYAEKVGFSIGRKQDKLTEFVRNECN